MKKIFAAVISLMTLFFVSCGKVEVKNEKGWYTNYNACLEDSKKSDKRIMLIVSRDSTDEVSATLKESVFYTPEFAMEYGKDYNFCEIDISPELFQKANPKSDAPKDVLKDAKKYKKILDERMRMITTLGVQFTPSLYIMTKDGYVLQDYTYLPFKTVAEFTEMISEFFPKFTQYEELVAAVETSKGMDKVNAIDDLCESTHRAYRYFLTPLMRQVEKLDKKNESGLVGKYVMAIATSDAMDAYMARKPEKVSVIYEKSAEHPSLDKSQKQQQLYAATYVIGTNTPSPEETEKMISLLEKTIAVDPESQIGQRCQELLEQVKEFKVRQEEVQKRIEEEGASEDDAE